MWCIEGSKRESIIPTFGLLFWLSFVGLGCLQRVAVEDVWLQMVIDSAEVAIGYCILGAVVLMSLAVGVTYIKWAIGAMEGKRYL
jgi:uncharacterized membrane protein (DUF485 family)